MEPKKELPTATPELVKAAMRRSVNKYGSATIRTTEDGTLIIGPDQATAQEKKRQAGTRDANREKNRLARKTRRKQRGK